VSIGIPGYFMIKFCRMLSGTRKS